MDGWLECDHRCGKTTHLQWCALLSRLVGHADQSLNTSAHEKQGLYYDPDGTPLFVIDEQLFPSALTRGALLAFYRSLGVRSRIQSCSTEKNAVSTGSGSTGSSSSTI